MVDRLKIKMRGTGDTFLFHDTRGDIQNLAKACKALIDKVNELVDEVNELKRHENAVKYANTRPRP